MDILAFCPALYQDNSGLLNFLSSFYLIPQVLSPNSSLIFIIDTARCQNLPLVGSSVPLSSLGDIFPSFSASGDRNLWAYQGAPLMCY